MESNLRSRVAEFEAGYFLPFEKLFLKRSVLGLGRVMNRDVARMLEQIKSLYALNTNIALLNITFSLSGSSPKYCSFVSLVREKIKYHQFCSSSVKRIKFVK